MPGPRVVTTAEYLDARKPRIPDFPHTAPAYDAVTVPVVAPYPAACIQMGQRCECYSQQATRLMVSLDTCQRTVRNGYFVDWQQPQQPPREERKRADHPAPYVGPASPPVVVQVSQAGRVDPPESSWAQGLAVRNAQVRSQLER